MSEAVKKSTIFDELEKHFSSIKNGRPLSNSEQAYFNNTFIVNASYNSNAIEGNSYSLNEVDILINSGYITRIHTLRESEDIVGYKQAFDYLSVAAKEGRPFDEELIRKVHSFVHRGEPDAGQYRKVQNYIGNAYRIVYIPPSPKEIPSLMADYAIKLEEDRKKNEEMIRSKNIDWDALFHNIAKHHIEFENIHPFIDGNGRTGRLLIIYELLSIGLPPLDVKIEEQSRYYQAISSYRDKKSMRSKTDKMAKLLAKCELDTMKMWLEINEKVN